MFMSVSFCNRRQPGKKKPLHLISERKVGNGCTSAQPENDLDPLRYE